MHFKIVPGILLVALVSAQAATAMKLAIKVISGLKSPALVCHFSKVSCSTEPCPLNNKTPLYWGPERELVKEASKCVGCYFKNSSSDNVTDKVSTEDRKGLGYWW